MTALSIFGHVLGLILGSISAAALVAAMAWKLAKRLHHPYWAPVVLLILGTGIILAGWGRSEFVGMVLGIGLIEVPILWLVASDTGAK